MRRQIFLLTVLTTISNIIYASFPVNKVVKTDNKSILNPDFIDYLQEMIPLLLILTAIIYIIVRLIQRKPLKIWEKVILWLIGIGLISVILFWGIISILNK